MTLRDLMPQTDRIVTETSSVLSWTLGSFLLLQLLGISHPALANDSDGMPKIQYGSAHKSYPTWVAADVALNSDGVPDPNLFAEYVASRLLRRLDLEPAEDGWST